MNFWGVMERLAANAIQNCMCQLFNLSTFISGRTHSVLRCILGVFNAWTASHEPVQNCTTAMLSIRCTNIPTRVALTQFHAFTETYISG